MYRSYQYIIISTDYKESSRQFWFPCLFWGQLSFDNAIRFLMAETRDRHVSTFQTSWKTDDFTHCVTNPKGKQSNKYSDLFCMVSFHYLHINTSYSYQYKWHSCNDVGYNSLFLNWTLGLRSESSFKPVFI